jgi:hypothetical protein
MYIAASNVAFKLKSIDHFMPELKKKLCVAIV